MLPCTQAGRVALIAPRNVPFPRDTFVNVFLGINLSPLMRFNGPDLPSLLGFHVKKAKKRILKGGIFGFFGHKRSLRRKSSNDDLKLNSTIFMSFWAHKSLLSCFQLSTFLVLRMQRDAYRHTPDASDRSVTCIIERLPNTLGLMLQGALAQHTHPTRLASRVLLQLLLNHYCSNLYGCLLSFIFAPFFAQFIERLLHAQNKTK